MLIKFIANTNFLYVILIYVKKKVQCLNNCVTIGSLRCIILSSVPLYSFVIQTFKSKFQWGYFVTYCTIAYFSLENIYTDSKIFSFGQYVFFFIVLEMLC